jgi:uncharacterized protein YqgV (UPF0045/DUF77 family)
MRVPLTGNNTVGKPADGGFRLIANGFRKITRGAMRMVLAQVSLYPIEAPDADKVINSSIAALTDAGVEYDVGPVSTEIRGSASEVFSALQRLFDRATRGGGEVSLVATITNSQP